MEVLDLLLYSSTGVIWGFQMFGLHFSKKATMFYRINIIILSGKLKENVKIFSEFKR